MISSPVLIIAVLSRLHLSNAIYFFNPGYGYAAPNLPLPYHYQPPQNFYNPPSFYYYNQYVQTPAPQAQSIYVPPRNAYSGYSVRTAFGDGGASQVFFVTGPHAKDFLQESIKLLQTAPLNIPGISQLTLSRPVIDEFTKLTSNSLQLDVKANKTTENATEKPAVVNTTSFFGDFPDQFSQQIMAHAQQQNSLGSGNFFYNIEVVPPKIGDGPSFPIPLFSQKFFGAPGGFPSLFKSKDSPVAEDSTTTLTTEAKSSESSADSEVTTESLLDRSSDTSSSSSSPSTDDDKEQKEEDSSESSSNDDDSSSSESSSISSETSSTSEDDSSSTEATTDSSDSDNDSESTTE